MIKLTDKLWIGDSTDGERVNSAYVRFDSVLNVAQDLQKSVSRRRHGIEYAQVGLIDGPGNLPAAYCAAVMTLFMLLERGSCLVYCHSGGRSLAVAVMYLVLRRGKTSNHSTFLNHWLPWDQMIEELRGRVGNLPDVHSAHKEACDKLPFSLLEILT